MHTVRVALVFPVALLAGTSLAGCGEAGPGATDNVAMAGSGLETLAVESGVLVDPVQRDPAGSYGRGYEGGRDRLCVLDARVGDRPFGLEMRIGLEEHCRGAGRARQAGDTLILTFAGGRCVIVARYEGDRIVMPGAVDLGCASLCTGRGSFAGASFPRTGDDGAAARATRDGDGKPLCGGG